MYGFVRTNVLRCCVHCFVVRDDDESNRKTFQSLTRRNIRMRSNGRFRMAGYYGTGTKICSSICSTVSVNVFVVVDSQVSHHPPAAAQHTEGRGWTLWQEFTMSSKFRGKYLSIIPLGISHLEFKKFAIKFFCSIPLESVSKFFLFSSGNVYSWRKVTTTVHNIIVGKLWVDNHGEMTIENHKTGDKCHLKYIPYSYFSRETPRKVRKFGLRRGFSVV